MGLEQIFRGVNPVVESEGGGRGCNPDAVEEGWETVVKLWAKLFYAGNFGPKKGLHFGGTVFWVDPTASFRRAHSRARWCWVRCRSADTHPAAVGGGSR